MRTPHNAPAPPVTGVTALPPEHLPSNGVTGVTGGGPLSGLVTGAWLEGATFPPVTYAVPSLLPEGFTLLVGAPKAGKSWLALDIAYAVAEGGTVLGQKVEARPVLYLALEDSHRRLRSRAKTLYPTGSIPEALHVLTALPSGYAAPEVIEAWLTQPSRSDPPPLVIVDTLAKVRPGRKPSEGVYEYDYRVGGRMKALADSWPGACLMAVHHDRKASSPDFVDDVSGTNGLSGAADAILVLRRDRNTDHGALLITGRDVMENGYAVQFTAGRWTMKDGTPTAAAAAFTQTAATVGRGDTARLIVDWLAANQPASPKRIADALDLSHDAVKMSLSRMVKSGVLDRADGDYFLPDYDPADTP